VEKGRQDAKRQNQSEKPARDGGAGEKKTSGTYSSFGSTKEEHMGSEGLASKGGAYICEEKKEAMRISRTGER